MGDESVEAESSVYGLSYYVSDSSERDGDTYQTDTFTSDVTEVNLYELGSCEMAAMALVQGDHTTWAPVVEASGVVDIRPQRYTNWRVALIVSSVLMIAEHSAEWADDLPKIIDAILHS